MRLTVITRLAVGLSFGCCTILWWKNLLHSTSLIFDGSVDNNNDPSSFHQSDQEGFTAEKITTTTTTTTTDDDSRKEKDEKSKKSLLLLTDNNNNTNASTTTTALSVAVPSGDNTMMNDDDDAIIVSVVGSQEQQQNDTVNASRTTNTTTIEQATTESNTNNNNYNRTTTFSSSSDKAAAATSATVVYDDVTSFFNRNPPSMNHSIFYNVYIKKVITTNSSTHDDDDDDRIRTTTQRTKQLIQEQIQQIQSNFPYPNATIYYNLIGQDIGFLPMMEDTNTTTTTSFQFKRIRYLEVGNEQDTLQDLYEYCQQFPLHTVTYLHDKGSHNPSANNDKIRVLATAAAVSPQCALPFQEEETDLVVDNNNTTTTTTTTTNPTTTTTTSSLRSRTSSSTCNVCSLHLSFLPNGHCPGNMWTAKCNYIHQLIPPKHFGQRRMEMFQEMILNHTSQELDNKFPCFRQVYLQRHFQIVNTTTNTTTTTTTLVQFHPTENGGRIDLALDRYALEHWVYSSPNVMPCVIAKQQVLDRMSLEKSFGGPRRPPRVPKKQVMGPYKIPWFLASGREYALQKLYGVKEMPKTSYYNIYRTKLLPSSPYQCVDDDG